MGKIQEALSIFKMQPFKNQQSSNGIYYLYYRVLSYQFKTTVYTISAFAQFIYTLYITYEVGTNKLMS